MAMKPVNEGEAVELGVELLVFRRVGLEEGDSAMCLSGLGTSVVEPLG